MMNRKPIYRARPKRKSVKAGNAYTVKGNLKRIQKHDYPDNWRDISAKVKAEDGHKCKGVLVRNGKRVRCNSTVDLEVHHIVPLSRGGTNKRTNFITLCENCHKKRHKHL